MPGIRRAQSDYSSVGAVYIENNALADNDKPRARYCDRCKEMFGVTHQLGPRIMPLDKETGQPILKPTDYDNWLECYGCGQIYAAYEVKQEAQLTSITEPDTNPFDRSRGIIVSVRESRKFDKTGRTQAKKKRKQDLDNIKDEGLKVELQKPGTELVSYHEERQHY